MAVQAHSVCCIFCLSLQKNCAFANFMDANFRAECCLVLSQFICTLCNVHEPYNEHTRYGLLLHYIRCDEMLKGSSCTITSHVMRQYETNYQTAKRIWTHTHSHKVTVSIHRAVEQKKHQIDSER